jgi:hypothetical protein
MTELRASGKKAMLGEVFVDLGLLSVEQVRAALAAQVQSKALRALAWPQARFRFMESFGPLVLKDRFVTPIEPLVVAALRLAEREDIDALLAQALPRHAVLRSDAPGIAARLDAFRFPPAEAAFVAALDGTHTVKELLGAKDADEVDRAVVLTALLLTDTLDLRAGATAGAVRGSQVPRPAPRSLAPLVPLAPISAPSPSSASPVGPETPKAPMAPLLAEKAYQAGKRLVRANRLPEAVVELRRAAALYGAVEYDLWAKWAAARADEENEDRHAGPLRAVAELAIAEDTERGFATFVLGHLARRKGEDAKAEALFERARLLDPEAIESGWEARLRLASQGIIETRSDLLSLAPLMTGTPVPPAILEKESESERGVPTLRGLATEEALASVRRREAERQAKESAEAGAVQDPAAAPVAAIQAIQEEASAPAEPAPALETPRAREPEAAIDEPPDSEPAAEPELAYEPYAPKKKEGGGGGWAIALLGIAVVGGGVYLAVRAPAEVQAVPAEAGAFSAPAREAEPAPAREVEPEPVPAREAEPARERERGASASYAIVEAGLPSPSDAGVVNPGADRGVLLMPPAADSHRVYVDGRLAGVPPPPIVVGCGKHVVKIGSQGREQSVIVPCGGSVSLTYP